MWNKINAYRAYHNTRYDMIISTPQFTGILKKVDKIRDILKFLSIKTVFEKYMNE